jgi:hypothetical protein
MTSKVNMGGILKSITLVGGLAINYDRSFSNCWRNFYVEGVYTTFGYLAG